MTRLHFRVDASVPLGIGHLVRSTALYLALKNDFNCQVLIRNTDRQILNQLDSQGINYKILPSDRPLLHEARELSNQLASKDFFITDNYHFGFEYQSTIKNSGAFLVCIDDLAQNRFCADTIINHNPGFCSNDYQNEIKGSYLLGLDYVLLRPPFLRPVQPSHNRKQSPVENVLAILGGTDPFKLSIKIAEQLCTFKQLKKIVLVVGKSIDEDVSLAELASHDNRIALLRNLSAEEIAQQMLKADAGFFPASSLALESLAMKLPFAVGYFVDNQLPNYTYYTTGKLAFPLGNLKTPDTESLKKKLCRFLSNKTLNALKININHLIDGRSMHRLQRHFRSADYARNLAMRRAAPGDVDLVYSWANEPEARSNSIHTDLIPYETHVNWYREKMRSGKDHYFILEYHGIPIGQIRFDFQQRISAFMISFSIDKNFRGKGLGKMIVQMGLDSIKSPPPFSAAKIIAYVKKGNHPSYRIFEQLGFSRITEESIKGSPFYVFEKQEMK